jgi:hypothetical protein
MMRFHVQSRTAAHCSARMAVLLVAALSLVGCGGASDEAADPATSEAAPSAQAAPSAGETVAAGSDAERWAAEVCGTVSQWRDDVREVVRTVPGAIADAGSREEAEAAIGTTLQGIADGSRAAAGEIADAELPDTENRAALEDELDSIQQAIDDAGTAMDQALAEDQTLRQFVSSVGDAVTTAEQSLTSVSDAWDEIGQLDVGAEVEAALQDDADCQALDRDASTSSTPS